MKRFVTLLLACASLHAAAQQPQLPTPDAKAIGMGGVTMTTLSGSHAIYGNSASAIFYSSPAQLSTSYYRQGDNDYYAVSGFMRIDNVNLAQIGWRQYLREPGNNDMALDMGYSRRIGDRWAIGAVGRYTRFRRQEDAANALSLDLSVMYSMPIENVGVYSSLRAGAKLGNIGAYLNQGGGALPMDITAGAAFDSYLSDAHQVIVAADMGYYYAPSAIRGFQAAIGAEYNLMQLFQFRCGYHFGESRQYYPNYATIGAGVRFLHLRLDFAYLFAKSDTPLHHTYSFSFGFDF